MIDDDIDSQRGLILIKLIHGFACGLRCAAPVRGRRPYPSPVHEGRYAALGHFSNLVVAQYLLFRPGVVGRCSVHSGGQVVDGRRPVVLIVQQHGHAVAQRHHNAFRSRLHLVVGVVPDLGDGHTGQLRLIVVPDIESVDLSFVPIDRILGDRVFDLFLVLIDPRHTGEGISPVVARVQFSDSYLRAVRQQSHDHARRTVAVLVVVVVPGLDDRDVHRRIIRGERLPRSDIEFLLDDQFAVLVGVRNLEAYLGYLASVFLRDSLGHLADIAFRNLGFVDAVLDLTLYAVLVDVLGQFRPGVEPVVVSAQRNHAANCNTIGIQLHVNACRTCSCLVFVVRPVFLNADLDLFDLVRIRQGGQDSVL